MPTLQPPRLPVSGNEWRRRDREHEIAGGWRCIPPRRSAEGQNGQDQEQEAEGAGCARISALSGERGGMSLDIPFYRTRRLGRSYSLEPRAGQRFAQRTTQSLLSERDRLWSWTYPNSCQEGWRISNWCPRFGEAKVPVNPGQSPRLVPGVTATGVPACRLVGPTCSLLSEQAFASAHFLGPGLS